MHGVSPSSATCLGVIAGTRVTAPPTRLHDQGSMCRSVDLWSSVASFEAGSSAVVKRNASTRAPTGFNAGSAPRCLGCADAFFDLEPDDGLCSVA
jgi:hypothetical protein